MLKNLTVSSSREKRFNISIKQRSKTSASSASEANFKELKDPTRKRGFVIHPNPNKSNYTLSLSKTASLPTQQVAPNAIQYILQSGSYRLVPRNKPNDYYAQTTAVFYASTFSIYICFGKRSILAKAQQLKCQYGRKVMCKTCGLQTAFHGSFQLYSISDIVCLL